MDAAVKARVSGFRLRKERVTELAALSAAQARAAAAAAAAGEGPHKGAVTAALEVPPELL